MSRYVTQLYPPNDHDLEKSSAPQQTRIRVHRPKEPLYSSTIVGMADPHAACFPGSARVRLTDGSEKQMSGLEVGDRVLTESGKYEAIETFFHRDTTVRGDFVKVNGRLALSTGHFAATDNGFVRADQLIEGVHRIFDAEGRLGPVTSTKRVVGTGIYAPVTESGTIVVDNVLCSCYSNIDSHEVAHFAVRTWVLLGNDLRSLNDSTGTMHPHIARLASEICI